MQKLKKPILSIHNFSLYFGKEKILDNLNFQIFFGEYVGLIGPNGAGKSSLLLSIMKHYKPSFGTIELAKEARMGYVPQHLQLQTPFSVSVEEFLSMGIRQKCSKIQRQEIIKEALQDVGLSEIFLQKNFQFLSGGQKQKIIIARSIIHKPNFLLFDEAFKEIDTSTKLRIHKILEKLNKKNNITILFVSHEIDYVVKQATRILCLNKKLYKSCHPLDFQSTCGEKDFLENVNAKQIAPIHHHH